MSDTKQPDALHYADMIENHYMGLGRLDAATTAGLLSSQHARIAELEAERDRFRAAYNEWHDKTEWVQDTSRPKELGMHRADVLRARIDDLEAQLSSVGAGGVESLRKREQDSHDFKNFHRLLCDRFDYTHDERDWRRDQFSLIEHIAAQPSRECLQQSERNALDGLFAVAAAAFHCADDSEDDGSDTIKVQPSDMAALGAALDALDELPDDQPGFVMGPVAKARWALRSLQAAPPAPADAIEALRQAKSVISSINRGTQRQIERFGEPVFWQRGEWVEWAVNEVLPLIEAALVAQPAPAGVAIAMPDERAKFEAWAEKNYCHKDDLDRGRLTGYRHPELNQLFRGWQARAALAAAPEQAVAVPSEVDLPDVEDMAHSAVQEALSYGVSHDVFHRWMRSVMDKTVQALAVVPAPGGERP